MLIPQIPGQNGLAPTEYGPGIHTLPMVGPRGQSWDPHTTVGPRGQSWDPHTTVGPRGQSWDPRIVLILLG